jgi:hypothetical protein
MKTVNLVMSAMAGAWRAAMSALARRSAFRVGPFETGLTENAPANGRGACYGREALIRRILSSIHSNSILIIGEPGIGKAAVLDELGRRLVTTDDPTYDFHPVHVDLRGQPDSGIFGALADAILFQLAPELRGDRRTERGADAHPGHRELAHDLRRVLRVLGQRSRGQVRIVLLIDGIDELESHDPRIAQQLRGLFMTNLADNLAMVASAVTINRHWEREGSPWYNFFEEIDLGPLDHRGRSGEPG